MIMMLTRKMTFRMRLRKIQHGILDPAQPKTSTGIVIDINKVVISTNVMDKKMWNGGNYFKTRPGVDKVKP